MFFGVDAEEVAALRTSEARSGGAKANDELENNVAKKEACAFRPTLLSLLALVSYSLRTMEKGMARGSVVTLWPARKVIWEASVG